MGMRFAFLAWFFFAACLGLSAGGPPDLSALLRSAEAGDADAQFVLAYSYYQGGSPEAALGWLKKSAERKHPKAWRLLGDFHAKGLVAKGKADPREAAACYLKAAALGDAAAMSRLADCYFEGRGLARSAFAGVRWLRASAEAGDRGAARLLAMRLAEGDDTPRDPTEAYFWLIVGAEGQGQGVWTIKLADYRAKVPASQRKATEEAAQKVIQKTPAHR